MLEPMFEVPGSNVKTVHIDEDTVRGKQAPRYEYHTEDSDSASSGKETTGDSNETEAPEGETSTGNSEDIAVEQSAAANAKI